MSSTASSRTFVSAISFVLLNACAAQPRLGAPLFTDDFTDLHNWHIEAEKPGRIEAANGVLDIDGRRA